MNREIKFKAWIPSIKKMGKHFDLHKSLTQIQPKENEYDVFPDEAVFMQYTGLKDKNGKEIYEGDIVVGGGCLKPIHVQWNNKGRWCFGESNLDFTESTIKQLEIIGNIYENPELCNH